jgi:hypothetical protein
LVPHFEELSVNVTVILKTRAPGSQQIWGCWARVWEEEIRSQDENIPQGNPESISQGKNTGSNYPYLHWSSREFHPILMGMRE